MAGVALITGAGSGIGRQTAISLGQAGDAVAQATRTNRSFIDTLNRLHRAEGGPLGWRILSDAYTGALVVLALTGVLMWSRLHGHRLLGIGLFSGMFVFALYFMTLTP